MEGAHERTHVLLMPRDLIHRAVTDPNNHLIGYVRDLLIDEADWRLRFLHVTVGGHLGIGDKHFLIPVEAVVRVSEGFRALTPTCHLGCRAAWSLISRLSAASAARSSRRVRGGTATPADIPVG